MSKKTTCLIIDDEKLARELLTEFLESFPDIELAGEASNGTDAVALIDKLKPDLIFLDVQMPGMTGFDVLDEIDHEPYVIFTTAYDQYAIQAFEKNAVDYLLNLWMVNVLKRLLIGHSRERKWKPEIWKIFWVVCGQFASAQLMNRIFLFRNQKNFSACQ